MKKILNSFGIGISAILLLTGCSTGPGQPQVYQIDKSIANSKEKVTIRLNFPKNDPITNKPLKINKNKLYSQITRKMYNLINYYSFRRISKYDYRGVDITREKNFYKIDYKNGYYYGTEFFLTEVIFKIPYQNLSNSIVLKYPTNYTIISCKDPLGFEIKLLDNPKSLQRDVYNILNKLSKTKLYIQEHYTLHGEINTKYPADSIYANFKRLMGQYIGNYYWIDSKERISSIEKENTFNLKIKNKTYPINIKVYPYRNGSKVIYTAYISYKIYSDGTSTLTKQDIENAKKEIERVIND